MIFETSQFSLGHEKMEKQPRKLIHPWVDIRTLMLMDVTLVKVILVMKFMLMIC